MAIESLSNQRVGSSQINNFVGQTRSERPVANAPRSSDNVTFSTDAMLLMEAKQTAQAAPDVRQNRVDELRPLVQSGAYEVSSYAIAEGIVREEAGLFI
ncbi:MAG: flagellar biosynthesis anti-sigma factor FlgM [Desulfovibrionaceae bacterium]|nr:flagellar biosynthesis anti-sigma factor FlgM [Desulfovibrionaceae bacterium]